MMGKPPVAVYERFREKYFALCREAGLEQYLVPYLMSSHPGTTLADAVELALKLKEWGATPEQVQDFYPTPGTISTVMYYTGIHPLTGKPVAVTTDPHEKALQRALLQYDRPENANLVREALRRAGREDLIGTGKECLVRPAFREGQDNQFRKTDKRKPARGKPGGKTAARPSAGNVSEKKTPARQPAKKTPARASAGKNTPSAKQPFYQAVLDSKKPKKSKLERVFGEDAVRILREADALAGTDGKNGKNARKSKENKPSGKTLRKKYEGK